MLGLGVGVCKGSPPGEFQVTVCGVTVGPFSRHKGNQRPKCLQNKAQMLSQPQFITQKGVHAHPLTAREREHWFLQHLSHFLAANFGRQ